jgi:uncharacterized protein YbjQ (UPF0145 family)
MKEKDMDVKEIKNMEAISKVTRALEKLDLEAKKIGGAIVGFDSIETHRLNEKNGTATVTVKIYFDLDSLL